MEYEVSLDGYDLVVKVHSVTDVKPNHSTWDNDWDYYGYSEIEFEVIAGTETDDDGNETEMTKDQLADVQEEHGELIEEKLWEELREEQDYD